MKKNIIAAIALSFVFASGAALADNSEASSDGFFNMYATQAPSTGASSGMSFSAEASAVQITSGGKCATIISQGSETQNKSNATIDPDQLDPALANWC